MNSIDNLPVRYNERWSSTSQNQLYLNHRPKDPRDDL
ncbi:predicted protein [Botrytis cinerea T4]|uniref:Uncharacterized protein n=1 Tax=Botryotinia fuckeliana (strain T4) TaxID=999810 RepID=G2Y1F9_BOTF4|nr:predicted protein [Botrytis cinerea T4]